MMILIFALAANDGAWLEILLSTSLKGMLILIIAAALSFALRRAAAASRHLVWSLAIASLLALPVLSFGLPSWHVLVPAFDLSAGQSEIAAITPAMSTSHKQSPEPVAVKAASPVPSTSHKGWPVLSVGSGEQARRVKAESFGWATWALIIWLTGAALIFARLVVGTASVWWVVSRAERINDEVLLNLAHRLALRVGLTRQVVLLKSDGVAMPLTCGVMRSAILLPADANDWPDERCHVVLLHELAHVKRRDCLTQMLAQVACAIYWFNPLTWAAARQLRIERERACDDQVLDAGTKASDYADHLLDIARRLKSRNFSSLASVAIARRSQLEGRLLAILDPSVSRRGLSRIGSVAVGLIVACIILPLASLRPSAHTQARSSERADVSATLAIKSVSRSANESTPAIAPAQTAPQAAASEAVLLSEPQPDEIEDATPQPATIEPQPTAGQAASQQEKDSAVVALVEALKDEDAEVREHALFALLQIDGPRSTEALMAALKDPNPEIREKAVWGLGMRHGEGQVDALINALRDSNSQVREKAAWSLGMKGNQSAIEPLVNALKDEDAEVRQKAAWALGLKGNSRAVEPLIDALKDSVPDVREMAAWALGMKGDKSAMKALSAAMKDGNKDVRQKATWALGMLLMKNSESASDDKDLDVDVDMDTDTDVDSDDDHIGSGSGSGSGSGVGKGNGSGKGIGKGKAKPKAKPE